MLIYEFLLFTWRKIFVAFFVAKKNDKRNIKKKLSFIRLPILFWLVKEEIVNSNFIEVRISRNKKVMKIIYVNNKRKIQRKFEREIFI